MTEQEWLTSTDPQRMLNWVKTPWPDRATHGPHYVISDRKLRLFACACCRRVWDTLPDDDSRRQWTDIEDRPEKETADSALELAGLFLRGNVLSLSPEVSAGLLRDIVGNPFRPTRRPEAWIEPVSNVIVPPILHDGFPWLTSNVLSIAQRIHDERRFDELPILGDALEDAGCGNQDMLSHARNKCPACTDKTGFVWGLVADCRLCHGTGEAGPHVRGCWVLDLILGKG